MVICGSVMHADRARLLYTPFCVEMCLDWLKCSKMGLKCVVRTL